MVEEDEEEKKKKKQTKKKHKKDKDKAPDQKETPKTSPKGSSNTNSKQSSKMLTSRSDKEKLEKSLQKSNLSKVNPSKVVEMSKIKPSLKKTEVIHDDVAQSNELLEPIHDRQQSKDKLLSKPGHSRNISNETKVTFNQSKLSKISDIPHEGNDPVMNLSKISNPITVKSGTHSKQQSQDMPTDIGTSENLIPLPAKKKVRLPKLSKLQHLGDPDVPLKNIQEESEMLEQSKIHQTPESDELISHDQDQGAEKLIEDDEQGDGGAPGKSFSTTTVKIPQPEQNIAKMIEKMNCHRGHLARIKHKCLITLLSLLEMCDPSHGISNRIRRTIPTTVLMDNLIDLFEKYQTVYKDGYFMKCFNTMNNKIDPEQKETLKDELIIETGFNLFICINILLIDEPGIQLDSDQQEIYNQIIEYNQLADDGGGGLGIFGDLTKITSSLISGSLGALKEAAEKAKEMTLTAEEKEKIEKEKELQKQKRREKTRDEALKFFCNNTVQLEFVRGEQISKCYFPLLPFCKTLPKENKDEFHDEIDINNPKGKLRSIMEASDDMIRVMQHEEDLREIFQTNFFLSLIASNKELWGNLAFGINILLNLVILVSYSSNFQPLFEGEGEDGETVMQRNTYVDDEYRLYDPRFWGHKSFTWTPQMIFILGLLNLIFSGLVVSIFCIKKAPLLLKDMWIEWYNDDFGNKGIKILLFFVNIGISIYKCAMDFDFVFYSCYIVFCVVGLIIHPFFFGWGLLVDFLRIKLLKNVVKAVWIPRESLSLTFLVFVLVEYYFTLIILTMKFFLIFTYLWEMYEENGCDKLWKCTARNFDYTFKEGGALGSFLTDGELAIQHISPVPLYDEDGEIIGVEEAISDRFVLKLLFDNLFVWILPVLLISMVAGIIIDTFGSLKQELQEKEDNYEQYCFICTYDREKIDKSYDVQDGFKFHIKKHHYLWNYVFFKAYIDFKDKTEYSGNETYVVNQYRTLDVSWFPYRKSLLVKDEESMEEQMRDKKMQQLDQINQTLAQEILTLQVRCSNVMPE